MSLKVSLQKAGEEILEKIGRRAVQENFISGTGMAIPGKVTSRTGNLMRAVLGDKGSGGRRIIDVSGDPVVYTIGVDSTIRPQAALIHEGGVRVVTEQMRRFFWAKYFTTPSGAADYTMWRALRWKKHITYQPRPYLGPTVHAMVPEMKEILRKHGIEALRIEIKKIITGANKTVTPTVG